MYIFVNAIKNIGRNKGRNILMGVIILITITVSIISLCINNTTNSIIDDYKSRFGSEVTIAPDMTKVTRVMNINDVLSARKTTFKAITPQQYLDFARSEYLKEAVITASAGVAGDGIKAVDEDNNQGVIGRAIDSITGSLSGDDYAMPTMTLIGNQWDEFNKGYRKLAEGGKMPENDNECIISKELADLNNLKVGDKIKLKSSVIRISDNNEQEIKNNTVELTITGIFFDATEEYSTQVKISSLNRRNEILTTIDTMFNNFGSLIGVNAKYYLKNPSMLEDFEAELRAKGLDEYYLVSTDEAGYQKVVGPVEGLKKGSLTFMIVVLIFGSIILMVLSSIAVRERKYEIGVLRAMGMKKKKVALGLWLEMLIITALCLAIGFGIGSVVAQPVSDTLLAGQIENAKMAANQGILQGGPMVGSGVLLGRPIEKEPVPLEQVDVSVGMDTIIEMAVIALALASLASLTAITKITKYEPIKILMERN
ncbi:MAG: ABC transporter permease [Clostridiaceae bacterium]|nr:ABC transporter permease [Clostridiaceae bacterium]